MVGGPKILDPVTTAKRTIKTPRNYIMQGQWIDSAQWDQNLGMLLGETRLVQ